MGNADNMARFECAQLPADAIVREAVLDERIGAVSVLRILLTVPKADFDEATLLNQRAKFELVQTEARSQVFLGRVTAVEYVGFLDHAHLYRITVRATFSKLDGGRRYRIFQAQSASEIIKEIVGDAGLPGLEMFLREPCGERDYCTQFGENDLAFVQRLCEQEGLFYAIYSVDGAETVVFADSLDGLAASSVPLQMKFAARPEDEASRKNEITSWTLLNVEVPPGVEAKGYDFRSPRKPLAASESVPGFDHGGLSEDYHLPGRYAVQGNGDRYVKVHAEALASMACVYRARASTVALRPGQRFALSGHPRAAMNDDYVVTGSTLVVTAPGGRAGSAGDWSVSHEVEVAQGGSAYRLLPSVPQPIVGGPQFAIVVGCSGEEITTDEHGRVKVKFRWDPANESDERSSCWLRVMQPWAGSARGVSVVPRIGDEVVVGFADGNPDFPFVLGSLYHGEAKAPASLPSVATDFVIRTRSSKGGGADTFNEIRLGDAEGSEVFAIQAQKDFQGLVKQDSTLEVQNDRSDSVGHTYKIEAGDLLEITVGQSKLSMDSAGNITLSGMNIKIEADLEMSVKGTNTAVKGVMLDLGADAVATLQAAVVKIN